LVATGAGRTRTIGPSCQSHWNHQLRFGWRISCGGPGVHQPSPVTCGWLAEVPVRR
jgi:hypothetical protein